MYFLSGLTWCETAWEVCLYIHSTHEKRTKTWQKDLDGIKHVCGASRSWAEDQTSLQKVQGMLIMDWVRPAAARLLPPCFTGFVVVLSCWQALGRIPLGPASASLLDAIKTGRLVLLLSLWGLVWCDLSWWDAKCMGSHKCCADLSHAPSQEDHGWAKTKEATNATRVLDECWLELQASDA